MRAFGKVATATPAMVGSPLLRNEDCSTLVNVSSVIGICALIVTFGTCARFSVHSRSLRVAV